MGTAEEKQSWFDVAPSSSEDFHLEGFACGEQHETAMDFTAGFSTFASKNSGLVKLNHSGY